MSVVITDRPASQLTAKELEPWKEIPVSVAVDLEPDQQLDNAIRPLTLGDGSPRLFGPAMTVSCMVPDFAYPVRSWCMVF